MMFLFHSCAQSGTIEYYKQLIHNVISCSEKMSSGMVVHFPADEGVEVKIEANLLSLNSSTLEQRDRNDVTEEC